MKYCNAVLLVQCSIAMKYYLPNEILQCSDACATKYCNAVLLVQCSIACKMQYCTEIYPSAMVAGQHYIVISVGVAKYCLWQYSQW